ncbi:hypothetical protein A0J57_20170 [Sphingobium sp. 22B]|nr:hypothetical protein AXW74_16755 [Sphingobium sp. AM]KYC30555.1 hypothetical protein A0J57_20170 [Sphingobium sp. 22B]OAP30274.1 hypothetical protein A8O16_19475 [Sphingobium sp. 20006FA]
MDEQSLKSTTSYLAYVVEPLSWAAIAYEIIKAVVIRALGEIVSGLLGGSSTKEVVRRLFAAIVEAIRQQLKEQWIDEVTAKLSGLRDSLVAYERSPESRKGTLDEMLVAADQLYNEAVAIGRPALGVVTVASALRFGVNVEQYKISKTQGDFDTVRACVSSFSDFVDGIEKDLPRLAQSYFTGIKHKRFLSKEEGYWYWEYTYLGQGHRFDFEHLAKSALSRHIASETENLVTNLIVPARTISAEMDNALMSLEAGQGV